MKERRFPPPWSVEDIDAAFVVRDAQGQGLAYIYYEEEPGRRVSTKLLTQDEARRIAVNIARLPTCCADKKPFKMVQEHCIFRESCQ